MQLIRKSAPADTRMSDKFFAHTRLQVVAGGCVWVAGLLIAGSDSPYMPWLNGIGAVVFSGASLALGKLLSRLDPDASNAVSHERLPVSMDGLNRKRVEMTHEKILSCAVMSQSRIFSNY